MSGINRVILLGRIEEPPELTQSDGQGVLSFTLMTNEQINKSGNKLNHQEKHLILILYPQSETAYSLLTGGDEIYLEGSVKTRSFIDETNIKRYVTEIIVKQYQVFTKASS